MNISDWIKRHAVFSPDKVALRTQESTYTYREFEAQIEATACALKWQLGVGQGDRVAFLSYNCPEFLMTLFACARIGALFVPLNWRLTVPEHLYILRDAAPKALLLQEAFATLVAPVAEALPHCQIVGLDFVPDEYGYDQAWDGLVPQSNEIRNSDTPDVDLSSPVLIVYTSGTTGYPKGAVHTQNAVQWNAIQGIHLNDLTSADHILTVLPLFHVGGFNVQTLPAFYCGATVTLHTSFDPEQTLSAISDDRPTLTVLVPSMMRAVMNSPLWDKTDWTHLRRVVTGSTIVPQALCEQFRAQGLQVSELYGATETCPIVIYKRPDYPKDKSTSIGLPALHCAARVVDSDGNDQPKGIAGEILVKGPIVMLGYWQNEAATTQALRNGWYHTGDMGYCDSDGYYFISGRKKNLIIKGGENIYPAEVERVLNSHPDIQESAVVGMPDERWQEIPVAVLVPKETQQVSISDVRSYLSDSVAAYKIPHRFVITDVLPKNALGKLQHFRVREELIEQERDRGEINLQVEHEERGKWLNQLDELDTMSDDERRHALLSYLQSHVGAEQADNEGVDQPETSQTLIQMGLDSLMAVEIRNELQKRLNITVPLPLFLSNTTLTQLVEYIDEEVQTRESNPENEVLNLSQAGECPIENGDSLLESTPYPLSYGQRGLWFDHKLMPHNTDYNLSTVVRIGSLVDLDALRTAFQQLLNRHPVLRTTFGEKDGEDGEPMQRVHSYQAVSFRQIDAVSGLSREPWDEDTLKAQIQAHHQMRFDLEQGPLFRVFLFTRRPASREHMLLLSWHHLVVDGISIEQIIRELRILYLAAHASRKSAPKLPPIESRYAEYVEWQRELLAARPLGKTEGTAARAYWHEQLAGELPLLNLPTDHPYPAVRKAPGASQVIDIPASLTQALRLLARQEGVTLYTLLLAAYQVFLHRYSGQDDLLVGTVAAGRNRPEFADLVGYFTSPVVMRAQLNAKMTFRAFLRDTHQRVLDGLTHQDYPFSLLVEQLQPPRAAGRQPIFQSSFVLQKINDIEISNTIGTASSFEQMPLVQEWNGLRLSRFVTIQDEAQFDLALELSDLPTGLEGLFKYSPELFESATIRRMATHFQQLLAGIVNNPEQPIAKLPLLTGTERHQILVEWNAINAPTKIDEMKGERCIHDLFEQQAARTPDALAVLFASAEHDKAQQLTYRELNERANQLAHQLQALGVKANVMVGLYVERSPQMLVGLLAILKAGGVYLPLDASYPATRLAFMISDAAVDFIVTDGKNDLPDDMMPNHVQIIDLNGIEVSRQPTSNPVSHVTPDELAYVIYTSGSTGQPKGVMVAHGPFAQHCQLVQQRYELTNQDRVLHFASLNFDISLEQIFPTLLAGASIVIGQLWSPTEFHHQLKAFELTVMDLPLGYFQQLLSFWTAQPALVAHHTLRLLIVGNEAIPGKFVTLWQTSPLRQTRLINAYGPTEAVISTTFYEVPPDLDSTRFASSLPIANHIKKRSRLNRQLYILNAQMEPVPIGVAGELYIGGILAQGYLNRPSLTSDVFVANPFTDAVKGTRLYKTGDLVRYLADTQGAGSGTVEFLGRIDQQVKIRGFRVELGEIEAQLRQYEQIHDAVVVYCEEQLIAYLVAEQQSITTNDLRTFLRNRLPEQLVPTAFVPIDEIPRSANGKIDRQALSALSIEPIETRLAQADVVAPRTATEQQIAAIWSDMLEHDAIGVFDNFFDLGGHSLLALQVTNEIQRIFEITLPIQTLFERATVARLAEHIEALAAVRQMQATKAIYQANGMPVEDIYSEDMTESSMQEIEEW